MALSPSSVRWYKTDRGLVTTALSPGKLHDVLGATRVGSATDYALIALVNLSATDSLTSAAMYLAVESGGITVAVGKSATGIVARTAKLVADSGDPLTGVTYSTPTTVGSAISIGTLAANQAIGFWVRRVTTGGSARSPETTTLIVTGTSSI